MRILFLFFIFIYGTTFGSAYAHTIDSVGEYRLEIGWMNEPVVSGETNAIELYVSPLIPCPGIPEAIKCAESQQFQNGIPDLDKTLKMQLVLKDQKITLPLKEDHNIAGKYYAFVNPTVAGFYQANVLGNIEETNISLSMHPPKVDERRYIEFPIKEHEAILEEHSTIEEEHEELETLVTTLQSQHSELTNKVTSLENELKAQPEESMDIGFVGIVIAIIAVALAIFAIKK